MKKPQCSRCHRPLTDPFSIAVGMGPECRGGMTKKGWKFPKPRYRVSHGRVELIGMVGKVEAPPPTPPHRKNADGEGSRDEKREIVRRILSAGGSVGRAAEMLKEYMEEKDSRVSLAWCEAFVRRTIKEMKR